MPRVSKAQMTVHRESIMDATAFLLRERGIDGVSVADAMAAAGLTHGGFYGHFASKDVLVAEACELAFARALERWQDRMRAAPDRRNARSELIDAYVSDAARNAPSSSCPATALAGDVARAAAGAPVRGVFTAGIEALIEFLTCLQPDCDSAGARRVAIAELAMMVGSIVLARATQGATVSDDILDAVRGVLQGGVARHAG